jgi:GNAT superfamily N-acetyltransferase
MISFDGESTYDKIYEGEWLSHGDYAVIHRMAVDFNHRGTGLASRFLEDIEKMCRDKNTLSIKVDTHRENLPMQKLLLKSGYKECGIIYLKDGNERLAYEKLLK